MTRANEGLCHPDKAQGGGDMWRDGQPGLVSTILKQKGSETVLFYTGSAPPPPPEVHAWIDCSRLVVLFFESWGSPGRRNLGSRSRSLGMGF